MNRECKRLLIARLLICVAIAVACVSCANPTSKNSDGYCDAAPDPRAEDFESWKQRAETGNSEAQLNLGFLYLSGRGVPRDRDRALDLYGDIREAGHEGGDFIFVKVE
ncbi:MAG TPA: sel1 repeat family protein [Myxococcales bacterium]|nr:sel1 repeat family protein [Myxococcales bacterium]